MYCVFKYSISVYEHVAMPFMHQCDRSSFPTVSCCIFIIYRLLSPWSLARKQLQV